MMQTLDPLHLPLQGRILIEASAGTGKTYTIVQLYLRLILGLGHANNKPFTVEQILVVTFTEAATQELRNRIRDSIHQLRLLCESDDTLIDDPLLTQIDDKQQATMRLLVAEQQMDQAAIYTIHGFCQRMLVANAFDANLPLTQHFLTNDEALIRQTAYDFWRCYFYPLSALQIDCISQFWQEPQVLLTEIYSDLSGELPPAFTTYKPLTEAQFAQKLQTYCDHNAHLILQLKQQWQQSADQIENEILNSDIDKRSYSKRFLPSWLEQINTWAVDKQQNSHYPAEVLIRFSQQQLISKTTKGKPPQHPIFIQIEAFLQQWCDIKARLLPEIIVTLRERIAVKKRQQNVCGFDDLLLQLQQALSSPQQGEALINGITQRYPVAMVDEFQDTDPIQYHIFDRLYHDKQRTTLLLIGDPKQAIYAFRGADIFTYIAAKKSCDALYTMETNWRSAPAMVDTVNTLFQRNAAAFIFEQIPFIPVKSAEKNNTLQFYLYGQLQQAMRFDLLPYENVNVTLYRQQMAEVCAQQIQQLLHAAIQYQAWLTDATCCRLLAAKDIAILVRNKSEAKVIKEALNRRNIPAVYLSNRETVFDTAEAKALYHLLRAALMPEKSDYVRSALATSLFELSLEQLDALNHDEIHWDSIIDQFTQYQRIWLQQGIFSMISQVMMDYHLAAKCLASEQGERRLTDLMHLAELLQEAAYQQDNPHALLRWLLGNLQQQNVTQDNQLQRLESDQHLVQIVTIHKSKGLEYPLVFLPFASYFNTTKSRIYHDRQHFQRVYSLAQSQQEIAWIEEERLSEDLRLLYVAVTRAIYHCNIGVAAFVSGGKKMATSEIHRSALGTLLQKQQAGSYQDLHNALNEFSDSEIVVAKPLSPPELLHTKLPEMRYLQARRFSRELTNHWKVTSYSQLSQSAVHPIELEMEKTEMVANEEKENELSLENNALPSVHTFPKGALAGTVLHTLLEHLPDITSVNDTLLQNNLARLSLEPLWQPVVYQWLETIAQTPLDQQGTITLQCVMQKEHLVEFPFYLSVAKCVTAQEINQLCQQYDPLSARCGELIFEQFEGMLKGFVDLVFEWQGRYYIVDYKSNWLGEQDYCYSVEKMSLAMCEHRYDLQYQLYTLALHRYLKTRLKEYDYDRHIGGVFYLFLRGMNTQKPNQGVFSCRPEKAFIEQLDVIFGSEITQLMY